MPGSLVSNGLTTTQSAFIEAARAHGKLYVEQPYPLYSDENHQTWQRLFERMLPRWDQYANQHFQRGIQSLCLDRHHVPHLEEVNRFLHPLTGFQARAVSGYVPTFVFFDCLRNRQFPTTVTIRSNSQLDYLPEPDIFHDIAGHVPMHTDPMFANTLVRFGECAHTAADRVNSFRDETKKLNALESVIRAMARFFWFTIEFGLMRHRGGLKVYGSGLLSSFGEMKHAVDSPDVQRFPLQLEWVVNQSFEIDRYQPLLFIVDGFDHLFHLVDRLEAWMKAGKLDNVAPGGPAMNANDLKSFPNASATR